jgi:phosphoribosylaminoimidazole (AIR) synthetase
MGNEKKNENFYLIRRLLIISEKEKCQIFNFGSDFFLVVDENLLYNFIKSN